MTSPNKLKAFLYPIVKGALISSIKEHGPITNANITSAYKRIAGQIAAKLCEANFCTPETISAANLDKNSLSSSKNTDSLNF